MKGDTDGEGVLGVRSGELIGTIELTESGELRGSSPGVVSDLNRMADGSGGGVWI